MEFISSRERKCPKSEFSSSLIIGWGVTNTKTDTNKKAELPQTCHIYGCPENVRESLSTATFPENFNGPLL